MRFYAMGLLLCTAALLCSCGGHSKDYLKKGAEIPPLVVPPGVPAIQQQPYYPIPAVNADTSAKSVSLTPPTLQTK